MDIEGIVHLKCGGVANRFKLPGFIAFVVLPLRFLPVLLMCPSRRPLDFI